MTPSALTSGTALLRIAFAGTGPAVAELSEALGEAGTGFEVVCRVDAPTDLPRDLEAGGALTAVLVELGGDVTEPALRQAVGGARAATEAPIILVAAAADAEILAWAGALDVDDVLVLPQTPDTLAFAVRKARRSALARAAKPAGVPTKRGRLVTVFSPKGGTGKTVLTTNLAASLAMQTKQKVLLVDLDLQFGDAAIMLGVDPERTLSTLVRDPGEIDPGKLSAYVTKHRSGLEILAAPVRPEEAELVTEQRVKRLLEVATESYDLVLVDTSPFFYGPMLALLDPTDELYVMCGLDIPTLKNVAVGLRTLELLGFSRSRTNLVLNRVSPNAGLTSEDVENALGVAVKFEVPNDPVVTPAVNRGTVAALAHPESEFAAGVRKITNAILGVDDAETPAEAPAPRRRWLGTRWFLEGRTA
jgi:pilus assembly protein CpaE